MQSAFALDIENRLFDQLNGSQFDWKKLAQQSEEIVVFGSVAENLATEKSDLDILLIGPNFENKRVFINMVDLVFLNSLDVFSENWLGSAIAAHVIEYGRWIMGSGKWKNSVCVSNSSINRKATQIRSRVSELNRKWDGLLTGYRRKHITKARRDLQRLKYLNKGHGSPCSQKLDIDWARRPKDCMIRISELADDLLDEEVRFWFLEKLMTLPK